MSQKRVFGRVRTTCTVSLLMCSAASQAGDLSATAGDISGPPQATVHFADLNLSVPQGAEALYARILGAARQVCHLEGEKNLAVEINRRACTEKAIADAVTHVDNAQLTAVYEAHQGQRQAARIAAVVQR